MVATRLRDAAFKHVPKAMPLGTTAKIEGPFGNLTLHNDMAKTACSSRAALASRRFQVSFSVQRKKNCHTTFSCRTDAPEDAPFLEELEALKGENPDYKFISTMTEMQKSHRTWLGETGLINKEDALEACEGRGVAHLLHCRSAGDGRAYMKMLNRAGVDDDDIRTEEFAGY